MSDLTGAPDEVIEVHEAVMANARERYSADDMDALEPVFTREETAFPDYKPNGKWIVGHNYEGMGPAMIWENGVWSYRYGYKEDRIMRHGHEEALGNAQCMFTG
jgi:hypothetical protein